MFAFVFMLPEEKRRVQGGARQNRKNKIRYLFLLYAKKEALSSQSRKKTTDSRAFQSVELWKTGMARKITERPSAFGRRAA